MRKLILIFLAAVILSLSAREFLARHYEVPILMYHSFDESRVDNFAAVTPSRFREQMQFIKSRGYRVVSLEKYCAMRMSKANMPRNLAVITIDDGYKDNLAAVEIIEEYDFPATIFMITEKIGENDYLSKDDIRWILDNTQVTIGSHTCSHAYLPDIDDLQLDRELSDSRSVLEEMFSLPVLTISFPSGGFDERVEEKLKSAGYICACATNRGFSRENRIYALRRIKVTQKDRALSLWIKLSGYYDLFRKPKNPY